MVPILVIYAALITISLMISAILAIAWHEFGRPRHALTWAVAFGFIGIIWTIDLCTHSGLLPLELMLPTMLILAGLAIVLITLGFRQRGGITEGSSALLVAALVHGVLVILLAAIGASRFAQVTPLSLLNAAMFWFCTRALTGRRRGERIAARAAQAGLLLLSLLNFAFLIGLIGTVFDASPYDLRMLRDATNLLLPAIITIIGLFTLILLAADLADQTRRLAASDRLTGMLNRRGFDEAAQALLLAARRGGRALALVLIDVDRFKDVNDAFGHPIGDRVLCALADCIAHAVDRRDVFARIGGEEFALVLADRDLIAAGEVAEKLRLAVERMPLDLPEPMPVTASFGVTAMRDGQDDLPAMLKRADEALYRAKADGRNLVVAAP